ncbi:MAG: protein kinase [Planctomyces sp.]|nr:protein kinase [Planctomyces sp.]
MPGSTPHDHSNAASDGEFAGSGLNPLAPFLTTDVTGNISQDFNPDSEPNPPLWILSPDENSRTSISPGTSDDVSQEFRPDVLIHERYLLSRQLGRGGMGQVWLAHDQLLNRTVAMKVLTVRSAYSQTALQEELAREARLGASLNDVGIAAVYDFGVHAGRSFTIFEYVEGETLRERLKRSAPVPFAEVSHIVRSLARSLDFAHSRGIIHRDLKPENICLTRHGQPKILDFGIARDLKTDFRQESFCGTPHYAAPEQAACSATDARTDQYALGLLAWEMITGTHPFQGTAVSDVLRMHREAPLPDLKFLCPGLPESVVRAIQKSLSKSPADRFATCQEFTAVFDLRTRPGNMTSDLSESVSQDQLMCMLCYAGEDSLLAAILARQIEQRGIRTWLLQRDANPESTFRSQFQSALQQSGIVVPLISRHSVRSEDFAEQIIEAGGSNRPFVPLLSGMTNDEFERLQPRWRPVLGPSSVSILGPPPFSEAMERISRLIDSIEIRPGMTTGTVLPDKASLTSSHAWATDASQIEIRDLNRIVFRTPRVNDFLNHQNRFFLIGTKGQGKSLLLSYKRHLLTQSSLGSDADQGICFIPQGRPFLDFMSEVKSLSSRLEKPLSELSTCKRFWMMALRVSAVSHHPDIISTDEQEEIRSFPPRIRRWLNGEKVAPSVAFKELISLPFSQANGLMDDSETLLDQKLRSIHNSVCFFVDKVDQAVRQLSREAWIMIQAGLIEAGWELMNANSHIKVFASIRQEAFVNYQSDVKCNLLGAATVLEYSDRDLESLMDQLCGCYESMHGFKEFLGIRVVKHPQRPVPEDSFQFVRRHTFGRPRDLVIIAAELSAARSDLSETAFCETVRRTGSRHLVAGIFEEMRVFLDCLGDPATRLRFLQSLHTNIFSRTDAVSVCAKFNGVSETLINDLGDDASELFHPFQDLYFAGLLGVIQRPEESDRLLQTFRRADDLMNSLGAELPVSPYYVLHPSLSSFVRSIRRVGEFRPLEHLIVGQQLPWERWYDVLYHIELAMRPVVNSALRSMIHRLLRTACEVLRSGTPGNLPIVLGALPDWTGLQQTLAEHQYVDLALWLEELRHCRSS